MQEQERYQNLGLPLLLQSQLNRLLSLETRILKMTEKINQQIENKIRKLPFTIHRNMPDGSRFRGQISNKMREGIGQNLFPDGLTYKGEFKRDKVTQFTTFMILESGRNRF